MLIKTIEVTTGVRIDHFAEVGFGGFVKVTDAVGGVGMCLDKPIKDELSGANLKAGCQTLNGAQALAYVRERYADPLGDIGRMQRQRAFLAALAHKVSSAGVILNPFKLVPVLDNSLAAFKVSDGTSLGDLYDMFQSMKGVSGGSGHTIVVPIANEDYNVPGVGSSILWDKTKAAQLWSAVINDTPMPAFRRRRTRHVGRGRKSGTEKLSLRNSERPSARTLARDPQPATLSPRPRRSRRPAPG